MAFFKASTDMTTPAQPVPSTAGNENTQPGQQKTNLPHGGGGSGGLRRGSGSGSGGALYNRRRNSSGDKLCRGCFIRYDATCPFSIENLPYGVFSTKTNVSLSFDLSHLSNQTNHILQSFPCVCSQRSALAWRSGTKCST